MHHQSPITHHLPPCTLHPPPSTLSLSTLAYTLTLSTLAHTLAHTLAQVSTWSEELVDGFSDMTGRMGEPMSPLVVVEFEMGTGADLPSDVSHDYYMQKAAEANQSVEEEDGHERVIGTHETGRQLPASAELYMPHAFAERGRIAELCEWRYLEKKDVVVVRAVVGDDCWYQVPEADFDLLPAAEAMGGMPGLRIRIDRGGIYAVYSVLHSIAHQRVLALTFVSGHVIPLDPLSVKLWLVPDLPNMIDSVMYQEQARSGLIVLAGWSTKPLNATPGRTKVGGAEPKPKPAPPHPPASPAPSPAPSPSPCLSPFPCPSPSPAPSPAPAPSPSTPDPPGRPNQGGADDEGRQRPRGSPPPSQSALDGRAMLRRVQCSPRRLVG